MAKKVQESSGKSKIQETLDRLNKTYGVGTVLALDSKTSGDYDVISTGSIGFDYITLGVGGFVKGKMYELMGWESSGKSTICGHATAECQKKGGTVLYIDGEHAVDKHYFQQLGVDTTKMLISQPSSGEEGFNIALEMIKSGEVDLIIIDSDSSLIPKKVLDGEIGEFAIGKKAVLNSNAYPKLKSALANNNVCVIVISQYREKIGMMFGCLHGDTLVNFTDGRSISIKTVVNKKIEGNVFSINKESGEIEEKKIVDWHYNGQVDVNAPICNNYIHIETTGLDGQNTIGISVTPEHKVLTTTGWIEATNLKLHQQLVSKYDSIVNSKLADFLYGTYVGDCSTSIRYKSTASISFRDKNNPEYLKWKIEKLSKFIKFKEVNNTYFSDYSSEFMIIKTKYPNRDINAFFDNYSDLGLAVWFMDDVHFDNKNSHCRYILSVKRFKNDISKLKEIVKNFNNKLDLTCKYTNDGSIVFDKQDTYKIAVLIYHYVPQCMQYKLPIEFRNCYNSELELSSIKTNVSYPVDIKSIRFASQKQMRNKGKYDLSIEDNHNYLVGGMKNGVFVHNSPTITQGGHALKFYSDCRIEVSKSLAKEEGVTFGNLTKVKSTKNKMCSPYRLANFDIVFGKGIDKLQEIMKLGDEFGLLKKWGKIITYNNNKYDAAEFKVLLQDNEEFFDELKREIIKCIINTSDLPTEPSSEEPITEEGSQEETK
jgi:recombination protein RecA